MRVLIVCDVLGEENNGTTVAAMNLIRFLKSRGHDVRVLCADQDKRGLDGIYVVPNLKLGGPLDAYVAKVGVTLAKADDAVVRAAMEDVDHIHVMLPFLLGMKVTKLAREGNLPITAGFHMQAQNFTSHLKLNRCALANKAVYRFIYRRVYRHVDAIHYPTAFIRDVFERSVKKPTNGYVISNGVHKYVKPCALEKPPQWKDKIVILTTGRYSREKSQDTLIKAVARSKHRDKIQLILGGQGPKEAYYRRLSKKLTNKPIFRFYSRTEIIDVLNCADLYVHPAEVELEGISCLEAIACGKLTIVSDSKHAATKGFARDERCIFRSRSPKDLARVIDYWIEHPEQRCEYEKTYKEQANAFDQENCMLQMERMMREVANAKREESLLL